MMNKCFLVGRITRDLELKYTNNNIAVTQFNIACNRPYTQNGQQQADFINCVAWRGQAENLCKFMRKGSLVGVDGTIQTRQYQDNSGQTRYVTEVLAERISFLESKGSQGNNSYQSNSQFTGNDFNASQASTNNVPASNSNNDFSEQKPSDTFSDMTNDDLPF